MPPVPRRAAVPLALTVLAYALALLQRPGELVADTKVHLYVEPAKLLHDALSAWSPTGDLGHVWAGQYAGYAWPMAPWFAAGDALGLSAWLVHRLWLGTLLALAAVGVVQLLRALVRERPGVLHVVAGGLYVVNPYVAVYANRTSVALLAYAALPWLLLAVHRGLQEPMRWRWPAVFALVLTSTAGGINAAVIFFVLLAPVALALYELLLRDATRRAVLQLAWRMVLVNAVASAWWVLPTLVHSRYGLNFLPYTEQPGTIWGVTSLTESLRLMGFWTSYIGVGYGGGLRPFASHGPALLFQLGVVVCSLLIPALALGSYSVVRRARYAAFFLGLALLALLVMSAGFPDGTPLRRALTFTYNHAAPVQVLRTTYKAGPLLALSLAVLGGLGFAWLWERRALRAPAAIGVAALAAVAAWPLASGRAPERQLAFALPSYWRAAADGLRGANSRALVLPGQLFAAYDWGETIDPILPALTDHPVATRSIVPYADLRSVDVQWAVDDLVSQERAVPGQLAPLLDLMGVGDVLLAADGDRSRSGELGAADAAAVLAGQGLAFAPVRGGAAPGASGDATRRVVPAPRRLAAPVTLPALAATRTRTGGIVRVLPRGPLTVADGGAAALTGLAAFGALDPAQPFAYAPDLSRGAIRKAAAGGAAFVIADGNRRQAFVASRLRGDRGPVLREDEDVSADGTMLDPFALPTGPRDPAVQTVSRLLGDLSAASAPASPQVTQFPDHRPFAAVDGDPSTAWIADRFLAPARHVLTLRFRRPRDVPAITVTPYDDARATVERITVNGREFALRHGRTRLRLGLRGASELRITLSFVRGSRVRSAGAGGLREVEVPGVRVREALRPPVTLERALAGAPLGRSPLTYLLSRTVADAPFTQARLAGARSGGALRDAQDPERRLLRTIAPPAARAWTATAWVRADPATPDSTFDALARGDGPRAGSRGDSAESSSRFGGLPRYRASGAFDGGTRAWVGQWIPGAPAWLAWTSRRAATLRSLTLTPAPLRVRRPTRVRLTVDGTQGPVLPVVGGRVTLPRPVTGHRFRLDVVAAAFPPGTPKALQERRAVGIGELEAPGLPRLTVPRRGRVALPCGTAAISLGARAVRLRLTADRAALDAGRPLEATACGAAVPLPAGPVEVAGAPSPLRVDQLRLASMPATRPIGTVEPAPDSFTVRSTPAGPVAASPVLPEHSGGLGESVQSVVFQPFAGRVTNPGRPGNGARENAAVTVDGPAWLVLGESTSRGWRATCDGKDLGAPRPMQGYANAWPLDRSCDDVDFAFAPNRLLKPADAVSLAACLALLAFLLIGSVRRGRHAPIARRADLPDGTPGRIPLPKALAIGVGASLVLGFVFALRAGVVLGPLTALVLWRGIGAKALTLTATALLALVVPLLYVIAPGDDRGGYSTTFATDHLGAHWVAVGAVTLLGLALVSTARARPGAPADGPPAAAGPRSAP